ncbi:hypothetical protein ES703_111838 [subsurface metagenome]
MGPGNLDALFIKGLFKPLSQLTGYLPLLHGLGIAQYLYLNAGIAKVIDSECLGWAFDKLTKIIVLGQLLAYPVYHRHDPVKVLAIGHRNIQVNPSPVPGIVAGGGNLAIGYAVDNAVKVAENGPPQVDILNQTGNAGNLGHIPLVVLVLKQDKQPI